MTTKTKQQQRKAGRIAVASAKDLQQQALTALALRRVPALRTEKDGRLYALAMLEALEAEGGEKLGTEYEREDRIEKNAAIVSIYRTGPQSMILRDWIAKLYENGTAEAIAGFSVVLSEFFSVVVSGSTISADALIEMERAGEFQPAGRAPVYRDPKAAAAAIKAGRDEYKIRLSPAEIKRRKRQELAQEARQAADYAVSAEADDKAKQPNKMTIDEREPEAIEQFLRANGATRRIANAFLVRPYDEMAADVLTDKVAAVAFAQVAAALEESRGNYFTICAYLERAERNMKAAVRARKDGEKLLANARRKQKRNTIADQRELQLAELRALLAKAKPKQKRGK